MSARERGRPVPVLALALAAISAAAVLVRLAEGVHPVAAAFWRTATVGLLLAPLLRGAARPSRRDAALIALGGALLALHFWSWFASLHQTTVLRSTVLVCLAPIWAGLLEGALLGQLPPTRHWLGVALALVGVGVMAEAAEGSASLAGDGLAILGGMLSASYLLVGRVVRQRVGIGPYGALVCLSCAAWLLPAALAVGTPLGGFSPQAWLALAGMALGPQLLGHIGLNYAIRYVPAAVVTALILVEPVGATALSGLLLGEVPTGREIAGGALILAGIAAGTLRWKFSPA